MGVIRWLASSRGRVAIGCDLTVFREREFGNNKRPVAVLLMNKDFVPKGSGHRVGKAGVPSDKRTAMNLTALTLESLIWNVRFPKFQTSELATQYSNHARNGDNSVFYTITVKIKCVRVMEELPRAEFAK